jgi:ABC-type polysaccharide/polyol phosphate transport system ATPase subunit
VEGAAVRFEGVSKRFRTGEAHDSLGSLLAGAVARLWRQRRGDRRANAERFFWALKDVDFEVARGEALGVIGPNGAGKSTALKLLAGILRPDAGHVDVHGRLAALIEVGAGFHGDLTGRENVYLNGAILGMGRREIRAKLDAIVAFAGIERFLDTPVKRYSSGMYARLGFSIAAHVDPDVLLVDEVLSVGDAVFRLRCAERMRALIDSGTTLVFVTHNLEQMRSICRRAVVLDGGQVAYSGPARDAVAHYLRAMSRVSTTVGTDLRSVEHGRGPSADALTGAIDRADLRFHDEAGEMLVATRSRSALRAVLTIHVRRPVRKAVVEVNMRATTDENLLSINSGRGGRFFALTPGEHRFTLALDGLPVAGGQYFWNVRVWDAERGTTELDTPFRFPLILDDEGRATGALVVGHEWRHEPSMEAGAPQTAASHAPIGADVGGCGVGRAEPRDRASARPAPTGSSS